MNKKEICIEADEKPFVVIKSPKDIKLSFGKALRFRDARATALNFKSIAFSNGEQIKDLNKLLEYTLGTLKEIKKGHNKTVELYIDEKGKIRLGE